MSHNSDREAAVRDEGMKRRLSVKKHSDKKAKYLQSLSQGTPIFFQKRNG